MSETPVRPSLFFLQVNFVKACLLSEADAGLLPSLRSKCCALRGLRIETAEANISRALPKWPLNTSGPWREPRFSNRAKRSLTCKQPLIVAAPSNSTARTWWQWLNRFRPGGKHLEYSREELPNVPLAQSELLSLSSQRAPARDKRSWNASLRRWLWPPPTVGSMKTHMLTQKSGSSRNLFVTH